LDDHLDAFITGDVYYHVGHDMISSGLTVVDPGHYTEKLFKYKVYDRLKKWNEENNWNVGIELSEVSTNPFQDLFQLERELYMEYSNLLPRFLKYVKVNSRSDEHSDRFPSTEREENFQKNVIMKDLEDLGLSDIHYNQKAGSVIAEIPSNVDYDVPVMGFLAHSDTADFNSENVKPQIHENYDGESKIQLGDSEFYLDPKVFPHLRNYKGQTIITASGDTLLGGDDKCGVSELMTFAEYLMNHPEVKHGKIRLAFTPDEEIGTGAEHFDVKDFGADFAFTVDGEAPGKLD